MNLNFKKLHIGELIKKRIDELCIDNSRLGKVLSMSEPEITEIYDSQDLNINLVLKLSKYLEYDFFRLYSQNLILFSPPSNFSKSVALPLFKKSIYTKEIIDFVIEQVESGEKTKQQIVDEYKIPKVTLYNWLRKYKK